MLAIRLFMAVQPYFERETPREIPISDAAENTIAAAERFLRDWVSLARIQAVETVKSGAAAAAMFATAGLLAVFAWAAVSVAIGLTLARWVPGDAAAALVAAVNGAVAAALVASARGRARAGDGA
jgi:hypothetical protein